MRTGSLATNTTRNKARRAPGTLAASVLRGERIGRLTTAFVVGRGRYGAYLWLCKCSCGAWVTRCSTQLAKGRERGAECSCRRCQYRAARAFNLQRLWRQDRTIWNDRAVAALQGAVSRDLQREFGPIADRYDGPFTVDAEWWAEAMPTRSQDAEGAW